MNTNKCNISDSDGNNQIGYLEDRKIIIILSIIGIIINLYFIYLFIKKKFSKYSDYISSIEKLYLLLSIFETIISIFWLINSIMFKNMNDMSNKCDDCIIISHFEIFFYIMDWLILSSLVIQIKFIVIDPFEGIQKANKAIIYYLIISFIFSISMCLICHLIEINGISPMITCLIDFAHIKEDVDITKQIFFFIFILIPFGSFIYSFFQFYIIINDISYKKEKIIKLFVLEHLIYISVYFILAIFLFIIYFLDYIYNISAKKKNKGDIFLIKFTRIVTILSCSTPLIVGIVRLLQNKFIYRFIGNNNDDYELLLSNYKFEEKRMSFFISKIFISICVSLKRCQQYDNRNININIDLNNEKKTFHISKDTFDDDKYGFLSNDKIILENEDFKINLTEYCPKLFHLLRKLDNINTNDMINSLIPEKNIETIKESQGRSGNFFLNSYDKKYIIKTINKEEVEVINNNFLFYLYNHFEKNPNSYIGRIYGLFDITMNIGFGSNKKIYFILMRNVYGIFNDNVLCIYDIKGSSLNRKTNFDLNNNKVLKDIDFREIEKYLLLTQDDQKKVFEIGKNDSIFFKQLGIMDYSLLIVKIGLSKKQIKILFGSEHKKKMKIELEKFFEKKEESFEEENENDINISFSYENFNEDDINHIKKYIFPSLNPTHIYIISIIDFFQKYNLQKKFEANFKKIKAPSIDISSIDPDSYSQRFIDNLKVICRTENLFEGGKWEIINSFI